MIKSTEYKLRRQKLTKQLLPNSIIILISANNIIRNGDSHYRFRQNSNFYYLTGCHESNSILVLNNTNNHSIMFNQPHDPIKEQWIGNFLGQDGVCEILGIDKSLSIYDFNHHIQKLLHDHKNIYFSFQESSPIIDLIKTYSNNMQLHNIDPIISELRLYKSTDEIQCIQNATNISIQAHRRAMQKCRSLQFEYQLVAELHYEFIQHGCHDVAYTSIVGSGSNACILHYTNNNQPLHYGDLVLIDAAAEYENYAADITRTFPVNGKFNAQQRLIYELVLKAQQAGISCIKPNITWDTIQRNIVEILTIGLHDLGLLHGNINELITTQQYKQFYMHNSGHWLGLDVHDCGDYKINDNYRPLKAGMVLTVEPGLYIKSNLPNVDKQWWNIGIRIEDDILVTNNGYKNLTASLPSSINDIEELMNA